MNDARPRVLVVEDETEIRRFVRAALERERFEVQEARDAGEALASAGTSPPSAIVLDLGLPDRGGVELIRELRLWSSTPIVVLSARSNERDKVEALDAGADDYVTKPFGVGELLARVRAALRRVDAAIAREPVLRFGDIAIDHLRHRVERDGEEVRLTPIEYRLLALLAGAPDRVLTHRRLTGELFGSSTADDHAHLRVQVANLRRKVEADPARPRHIRTETGVGYRFVP